MDKEIDWYIEQMQNHVKEIRELLGKGDEIYNGKKSCQEHARVEAYDLIVLIGEAFNMTQILESVPDEIKQRFEEKRRL